MRVDFLDDNQEKQEPEIVEPSNILDDPELLCPPKEPKPKGSRTNKHKVKPRFHDAQEHPPDEAFYDAQDIEKDFGPKIAADDLKQTHPARRKKLQRQCKALVPDCSPRSKS